MDFRTRNGKINRAILGLELVRESIVRVAEGWVRSIGLEIIELQAMRRKR